MERDAFASGNSCFTHCLVQKLQNSAKPNSGMVCRFSFWSVFSSLELGGLRPDLAHGF